MTTTQVYKLSLVISTILLICILILAVQQFCLSDFLNKQQFKRMQLTVLFITFSIILNVLVYLAAIYENDPVANWKLIWYSFEAIFSIVGFHIFNLFHIWSLQQRYDPINLSVPISYRIFFNAVELLNFIMTLMCHSFVYIFNSNWIIIYYIFLNIIIFIESLVLLYGVKQILKLLGNVQQYNVNVEQLSNIKHAKRWMKGAYCLVIVIAAFSVFTIFMCIEIIESNGKHYISFNHKLGMCVIHSFVLIVLSLGLMSWIYQSNGDKCCYLTEKSVCIIYGCDACITFWYDLCNCYAPNIVSEVTDNDDYKTAIVLQESTITTTVTQQDEITWFDLK
eukprot:279395_1